MRRSEAGSLSPDEVMGTLATVARGAGAALKDFVRRDQDALVADLRAAVDRSGLGPSRRLDERLAAATGAEVSDVVRRAAIAGLALGLPSRAPPVVLPPSVEALQSGALQTLAAYLADSPAYDPDCYAKDARFVAGLTVAAGAQIVDIVLSSGAAAAVRRMVRMSAMAGRLVLTGAPSGAVKLARGKGWRPWLEIHTDQRSLEEFNEAGWDACYHRVADILRDRPDLAGLWGASWFYDPQLLSISQRLAYLQERPIERGAIMVRIRGGAIHTQRAMETSPTRRALIVAGRYRPVCYAMFWPRRDLLAWASRARTG
jgi:hypothetical protein